MEFMSIGGNCADIGFLGEDRIRGPLDNVLSCIGAKLVSKIIDGTYLNTRPIKRVNKKKSFDEDTECYYIYDYVWISHNLLTKEYVSKVRERSKVLLEHINNGGMLTYCLNAFDIDKKEHKLNKNNYYHGIQYSNNVLEEGILYLKETNLLDRTIFIETKIKDNEITTWDYWSEEAETLFNKYNCKYITIIDNNIWKPEKSYRKFKKELKEKYNID